VRHIWIFDNIIITYVQIHISLGHQSVFLLSIITGIIFLFCDFVSVHRVVIVALLPTIIFYVILFCVVVLCWFSVFTVRSVGEPAKNIVHEIARHFAKHFSPVASRIARWIIWVSVNTNHVTPTNEHCYSKADGLPSAFWHHKFFKPDRQ